MHHHSHSDPVLENSPLLRCEPEYGAIVCFKCNNGFPWSPIIRHLSAGHHISNKIYGPVLDSLPRENLANDWENLRLPSNRSAPIEGLRIRTGYVCTGCGHKTTSDQIAKSHLKCGGQVDQVHLQCWNISSASAFWIVAPPPPPPPEPTRFAAVNDPSTTPSSAGSFHSRVFLFFSDDIYIEPSLQDIAIAKVLEHEHQRVEEEESCRIEGNTKDDTTRWLTFMQWREMFEGKDLRVRSSEQDSLTDSSFFFLVDRFNPSSACQECQSSDSHEDQ
jgi:hypothetical protein